MIITNFDYPSCSLYIDREKFENPILEYSLNVIEVREPIFNFLPKERHFHDRYGGALNITYLNDDNKEKRLTFKYIQNQLRFVADEKTGQIIIDLLKNDSFDCYWFGKIIKNE